MHADVAVAAADKAALAVGNIHIGKIEFLDFNLLGNGVEKNIGEAGGVSAFSVASVDGNNFFHVPGLLCI